MRILYRKASMMDYILEYLARETFIDKLIDEQEARRRAFTGTPKEFRNLATEVVITRMILLLEADFARDYLDPIPGDSAQ